VLLGGLVAWFEFNRRPPGDSVDLALGAAETDPPPSGTSDGAVGTGVVMSLTPSTTAPIGGAREEEAVPPVPAPADDAIVEPAAVEADVEAETVEAEAPADVVPADVAPGPPVETASTPSVDQALLETGPHGLLPRTGPDGRVAWQVYARPFDQSDPRPRIALVLGNLGLSDAATEAAIQQLPGGITLAFSPYAGAKVTEWIDLARAAGHEVMLDVPMEPVSYPLDDPGPHTLLTTLTPSQNLERLAWILSRFTGYVGVTDRMGSRFTTSTQSLRPILAELAGRGLLFVDSRSADRSMALEIAAQVGLPRAGNDRFIDEMAARQAIDQRLGDVEALARRDGEALAMGLAYPVTIERIAVWAAGLEARGFVLAPVSAIVTTERH
jgi:polysaccharide deacetylase 2 family uncharacterized protein YibQ